MDIFPGMVFLLPFTTLHGSAGVPKNKYCILIEIDPDCAALLICSEQANFAKSKNDLNRGYAGIDKENHSFLQYDSWIDCNEMYEEYTVQKIQQYHAKNPDCYCGDITTEILRSMRSTAEKSKLMTRKKRNRVCRALDILIAERLKQED